MPSRREIRLAINLRSALNEMREIHGDHVTADNLEWLAIKTLKLNQPTLTSKGPEKCPKTKK